MRQNIVYLGIKKCDGELKIQSVSIVDMINIETLYHAHNISWSTFYNKCCELCVGSIVCNGNSKRLKLEFNRQGIKFSDNKYVTDFYEFVGLPELSGRRVKPLLMLAGIRTNRHFDKLYHTMDISDTMAEYAKIWAEKGIKGMSILNWLVDGFDEIIPEISVVGKNYFINFIEELSDMYDIKVDISKLKKTKTTKVDKRVMYLWFTDIDAATISRSTISTAWASDLILKDIVNPSISEFNDMFHNVEIGEIITNVNIHLCERFLKDNQLYSSDYKITPVISIRDFAVTNNSYLHRSTPNVSIDTNDIACSIYHNLFSIDDVIQIRLRDKNALCKYGELIMYALIIHTLVLFDSDPRRYARYIGECFFYFKKDYFKCDIDSSEVYNKLVETSNSSAEEFINYLKELATELISKYNIVT